MKTLIGRLSRRPPEAVLEQLIYQPELTLELLQDEAKVTAWVNRLQQVLNEQGANGSHYTLSVRRNEERNLFLPQVVVRQHGVDREYNMNYEFLMSGEYRQIAALGQQVANLRNNFV